MLYYLQAAKLLSWAADMDSSDTSCNLSTLDRSCWKSRSATSNYILDTVVVAHSVVGDHHEGEFHLKSVHLSLVCTSSCLFELPEVGEPEESG